MNYWKEFSKGILAQNPIFILALGMCPTLAVTTSVQNAVGMGLSATFVLLCSNIIVSLMRKIIPDKIRIPVYIVVIATFVTVIDLFLAGYVPNIHKSLGIFIPLIVVNCVILGRAEAFANRNNVFVSILDALGMGLGFTGALALIGAIRELLGSGKLWGLLALGKSFASEPITMFILPPGAFLTLGLLSGLFQALGNRKKKS